MHVDPLQSEELVNEPEIPGATLRRIQVLELRQRLEHAVAQMFDDACKPDEVGKQNKISQRLTYMLAISSSPDESMEIYSLVRLARHVYAKSSDVMHGRVNMINVPQVVIDEWAGVVGQLEQLFLEGQSRPDRDQRG